MGKFQLVVFYVRNCVGKDLSRTQQLIFTRTTLKTKNTGQYEIVAVSLLDLVKVQNPHI